MIRSMTAFGRARQTVGGKDITVEIRSVNNRFFDCSVKLPRAFSFLEERIKPHLQAAGITRGKVDVFIGIEVVDSPEVGIDIDEGYARSYVNALYKLLQSDERLTNDISVMSVAQNKDVFIIKKPDEDIEKDWADLAVVLDEATEKFILGRTREGQNIETDLTAKVEAIGRRVDEIERLSETDIDTYREKLEARLREMLSDNRIAFDENRILTECAVFADKIAIDEELVRLRSHFDGFRDILGSEEPVGRRLDFLLQEINREVNTSGSKCSDAESAAIVVEMKCLLEKIREQVQNLE